jgi:DNA-binding transcriptional regulator YiaG
MTPAEYKALRLAAGLSQPAAAELLGVHEMTISDRERGRKRISEEAAQAMEHLSRCSPRSQESPADTVRSSKRRPR